MHEMRTRIITSPSFSGERVLGAILFENTMDRQIEGRGSADYLWNEKRVVPFLKVDKGLADEADGAQMMKPMPELDALLERAVGAGVFGTKMRSVIAGRRSRRGSTPSSTNSSTSGARSSPTAWFRSSSRRSTSTARPRPRPSSSCAARSASSSASSTPTST